MRLTVLDCVQQVLSKMNSDQVNSIGDTVESQQVVMELQTTFYDMLNNVDWAYQSNLISLEASGDTARPTHMRVPTLVDKFDWIKYNQGTQSAPNYQPVSFLPREEFVAQIVTDFTGSEALTVQDYSGAFLVVKNNKHPQWFTSFDDEHIVFDSYDATVDDTLQSSKIIAYGQTIPTFVMEDNAYPPLPAKLFPQLIAETTSACMWYWKQQQSPVDERRARRAYVRQHNNDTRIKDSRNEIPDFGR